MVVVVVAGSSYRSLLARAHAVLSHDGTQILLDPLSHTDDIFSSKALLTSTYRTNLSEISMIKKKPPTSYRLPTGKSIGLFSLFVVLLVHLAVPLTN